ncbi:hypothetical protein BVRB_7g161570 [Beta vulgaris subsp. vulgaris]|nr:hypothetical protein BVRB_7g161570 [Beta vulgaris subsp. vulgaris]
MSSARFARFATEVAPQQFVSVLRIRMFRALDTIPEEEKEINFGTSASPLCRSVFYAPNSALPTTPSFSRT